MVILILDYLRHGRSLVALADGNFKGPKNAAKFPPDAVAGGFAAVYVAYGLAQCGYTTQVRK